MKSTHPAAIRAALPLPLGEGRGEGTLSARELEATIAANVIEIIES